MKQKYFFLTSIIFILTFLFSPLTSQIFAASQTQQNTPSEVDTSLPKLGWSSVSSEINTQLDSDQKTLETIFIALQKAHPAPTGLILNKYNEQISTIRNNTANALTKIQTYDSAITSILGVIGDKPNAGEDPSIAEQRTKIQKISQNIKATMVRAKLYDLQARQLHSIVETLRGHIEQLTLSKKSTSPLSLKFWSSLNQEHNGNYLFSKHDDNKHQGYFIPLGVLISFIITLYSRKIFYQGIENTIVPKLFPYEPITHKFLAHQAFTCLLTGLICGLLGTITWELWRYIFLSQPYSLLEVLSANIPLCTFIIGATIPLHHWHKGFLERKSSFLLAIGLIAYAIIRFMQSQEIIGPTTNNLLEAILAIYGADILYVITNIHCNAIKKASQQAGSYPSQSLSNSIWSKILYPLAALLVLITIGAIFSGYVAFAFLLNGTLLTLSYAFGLTGLLIGAWQQVSSLILSPSYFGGKKLVRLGISPRRLEQINVLISAFGSLILLLVLIALIDNNGDYSLSSLWKQLHHIFTGNNIHGVPLSPETILKALAIIIGAHYTISFIRRWFSEKLFPTTLLDMGLQTSILSILTYCSWILVGLALFATFGVPIQNLTWVVSALSVGVGFGLQSIVKDFISGLILLAERPVQTGDIIEISGNRGEVRHINVRATDITLDDGSTLIVPNSVFITANVKNASFNGLPAHLSLNFTLPTETDLEKTRKIILDAIANTPMILSKPEPQIRIASLAGANINLTLEVCFKHAKDKDNIRDHLLKEIFSGFQKEALSITMA